MIKRYFYKFIYILKIDYIILFIKLYFSKKKYKYDDIQVYQKKDLVSIIVPVYNHAEFVEESIESCLNQTYKNIEIIIIDDGSTDNLQQVLDKYKCNNKISIYKTENQGLPKALTTGFKLASGEFYTWTSADNVYKKGAIDEMVRFLKVHPNIQMTYTNYETQYSNVKSFKEDGNNKEKVNLPGNTENLNISNNHIGACFLWRSFVGNIIGEWDLNMSVEDYDYWMRINNFFNIKRINNDKSYYIYRYHDNSITGKYVELGIKKKTEKLKKLDIQRRRFNENINVYSDIFLECAKNIKEFKRGQSKALLILSNINSVEKYKKYINSNNVYILFYNRNNTENFDKFKSVDGCIIDCNIDSLKKNKNKIYYIKYICKYIDLLKYMANNELFFRSQYMMDDRKLKCIKKIK